MRPKTTAKRNFCGKASCREQLGFGLAHGARYEGERARERNEKWLTNDQVSLERVRILAWLQSMRPQERVARKGGHEGGFIASRVYRTE